MLVLGARDLHAAFLELALKVQETHKAALLEIYVPKITIGRVKAEWNALLRVLDPKRIAPLMSIVALTRDNDVWSSSGSREVEERARVQLLSLARARLPAGETRWMAVSARFFDVWKVLLRAWLLREGALTAQELSKRSGASIPTVAAALRHLRQRNEIADTRNRPIELLAFPHETFREVLVLSNSLRRPTYYHDASGRPADPAALLRHLRANSSSGIAVGGVVAAKHYDPDFDLNGLPRLDVVVDDTAPPDWVRRLDPALRATMPQAPSPVLVVHRVKAIGENRSAEKSLPIADPVDTLLDLHELRLTEQADHMISRLRGGKVDR